MQTSIEIIATDITALHVDAIVNAANRELIPGGGVDGAIHRAGGPTIRAEAQPQSPLNTGDAVITTGGDLKARWVIHTVGPIWGHWSEREATKLLASCYLSALDLAAEYECESIAFPNIGTGVYGFPKPLAASTAARAVEAWVSEGSSPIERVLFACFDSENMGLYSSLLAAD